MPGRKSISQGRRIVRPTVTKIRDTGDDNSMNVVRSKGKRAEILRPKPNENKTE